MGIDYSRAREVFEQYLNGYDRKDGKVRLKITHTYGVVAQSTALAKRMRLGEEDTQLARIIALLHDIGRFEQLRRFDSFLPETMDHAAYGVELLFGEGMIRDFLPEDTWDGIIRTAIAKHSDYRLEGVEDPRTLLHARLIRDADKLDNCRVKLEFWVSYLAYFYDLNFRESLDIVEERDYVRRIAGRIPCSDPETARSMEEIVGALTAYVHSRGKSK